MKKLLCLLVFIGACGGKSKLEKALDDPRFQNKISALSTNDKNELIEISLETMIDPKFVQAQCVIGVTVLTLGNPDICKTAVLVCNDLKVEEKDKKDARAKLDAISQKCGDLKADDLLRLLDAQVKIQAEAGSVNCNPEKGKEWLEKAKETKQKYDQLIKDVEACSGHKLF